jgi:hypothetical protein
MNKKLEIGLLVLIICFVVALAGCTSNNNSSSDTGDSNTSSSNTSNSNDVIVEVSYPGNWGGSASGTFGYRGLSGQGDQTINLGSLSGSLTVSTWTTDGSSGTMDLTIKRDGKVLGSQSNTYGSASITVNL